MSYLLDTHILLWAISNPEKLSSNQVKKLTNTNSVCYVSIASLWEIAIKHSIERLVLKISLDELNVVIKQSGFSLLPITPEHIIKSATLPFHHRDPFDRLLISQAQCEKCEVMSIDTQFKKYEINIVE